MTVGGIVVIAPHGDGIPGFKAGLRFGSVTQMPFAEQRAGIPRLSEPLGITALTCKVLHRPVPHQLTARPFHLLLPFGRIKRLPHARGQPLFVQMTLGQPVVDSVLRGHGAGHDAGPGGRTHRGRTKEVFKPNASLGQTIQIGRFHVLIARAAQRPGALIVGKNE